MAERFVPINKGNYSMDTVQRDNEFEANKALGWEKEYKEYREKWQQFPQQQKISDYPLLVDLELSSLCNLKCPMCYTISPQFKKKVNTKLMDFELFKKIIDEIGGKTPALRLSLRGESLLHPQFLDCVRYAKSHGLKEVSTLTNGAKLKPEFARKVIEAGIDWITVSIDGTDEVYEKIRKPIKFAEILSNLKALKEIKAELGVKKPVIKVQGIWPAIRVNPKKYYDTFSEVVDQVAFNPLIDYLFKDKQISYIEDFCCPQQYQRLVVGADGLVMKCSNDEENEEVIGNLNHESVHQVWHGEKMQFIRDQQKRKMGFKESAVCRRCYLPRATQDEHFDLDDRRILIRNYVDRSQEIGT